TFGFYPAKLKEMLRFSLPYVPSGIGLFFLTYVDRLFIKEMLNLTELGLYGIGFRFATIVTVVMGGMTTALTPMIYSALKDKNTPIELARIFRLFLFVAIAITAMLSIFGRELLILLTTPAYYNAVTVIPPLVIATFLSKMYIFTPGLGIAKKTGHLATINVMGGIVNVGLNWLLLQWFGILGAALATLISYAIIFSVNMYFSQKNFHVPHRFGMLIRSILIAAPFITVGYYTLFDSFIVTIGVKTAIIITLLALLIINRLVEASELKGYILKLLGRIR
ncbi:MAG: polysaccharide biosynthesis C-terminal domain-containing protein, partial [Calditrichota bacterium]